MMVTVWLATGCTTLAPIRGAGGRLEQTPRDSRANALKHGSGDTVRGAPSASTSSDGAEEEPLRRRAVRIPPGTAVDVRDMGVLAAEAGMLKVDAFEKLLVYAGLDPTEDLPPHSSPLTREEAARLLGVLLQKPVTLGSFPPRTAAAWLLREVLEGGSVSRERLLRRVERFGGVAVLRPDGYLAWVSNGRTQQKVAPVEWKDGSFRAHQFELGRFYTSQGGVFRPMDSQLRPVDGPVLTEVYDDADVLNRAMEGAGEAFVELYHALGQFFTRPLDSLAALRHLPAAVAALIASSPQYWERFRYMTAGEQMKVVARLTTHLLATWGAASATTRALGGLGAGTEATVPVLSLSAQGGLVMERIAVPAGQAVSVLSGGPGAALILHRANSAAHESSPPGGREPGQWGPAEEGGASPRARAYQEQISGRSYDDAYWVGGVGRNSGGVKFDGFKDGVLLEAKGPGYANKFLDDLTPEVWFEKSGAKALVTQARRQLRAAQGTGAHIRWHVAEQKTVEAIRELFRANDIEAIEVVFTPPFL